MLVSTPQSKAAHAELARRELARRRLLQFTHQTHPEYLSGWVHDDICRRLERFSTAVIAKERPRLMLLMPPRHGKSELASIRFPAWHLGHHPTHEIINVGYNLDLPMIFSRKVREVLREPVYQKIFPETCLDPELSGAEVWRTTRGGGFQAAGVGGGITGKGAHIAIVDDPIRNQEDADSISVRDKLWAWYQSTLRTRLAPGGGILIIETWWNDDDLAGRVQDLGRTSSNADQFEIVKYPAIAEAIEFRDRTTQEILRFQSQIEVSELISLGELDPLNLDFLRYRGDALHPARYDIEALRSFQANSTPRIWSALYQQNPVPDEGMFFQSQWFRYEDTPPPFQGKYFYTAWDFAYGDKKHSDWTVGVTICQDENDNLHVVDLIRFKGEILQIADAIVDMATRWGTIDDSPYLLGLEDGAIYKGIEPMLKKRFEERRIYPSYEILKPLTDKMARAGPLQGRMQQHKVFFPREAQWTKVAVNEMLRFPAGAHDDVVDALAWAVQLVAKRAPPRVIAPPEQASWKDKLSVNEGTGSHMAA